MHSIFAVGLLSAVECTPIGSAPADSAPLRGRWGGARAVLTLTDSGGTVEYDCARGAISAPVRPDPAGNFAVAGTHVREHGGPIRVDEVPDSLPAHYTGHVRRDRMTLRVRVGADTLGPFELGRGLEPQLVKCL